jgi:hypothetical protein
MDCAKLLRFLVAVALSLTVVACGTSEAPNSQAGAADALRISVLSNRSDLVSGGDALVEVKLTEGVADVLPQILLNGADVSGRFSAYGAHRYVGLIDGMAVGTNVLDAQDGAGHKSEIHITNAPQGGPLFSGPQLQPWVCQDGAVDAQCNQPPVYSWYYKSRKKGQTGLLPYDPAKPPSDVDTTTTDQGVTLPFIVRVETGYQDRGQYVIVTLYQPDQAWTAVAPQSQFNHKLLIKHGQSCAFEYTPGAVNASYTYLTDDALYALGQGFAVLSTSLVDTGHDCSNIALQAESLVMAKERFIEQYGTLRYTISSGCSGGSLTAQSIANAYPGIYQGMVVSCSFPDLASSAAQMGDLHLLKAYFSSLDPKTQPRWSESAKAAVMGGPEAPLDAALVDSTFFAQISPTYPCVGVTDAQRYDPVTNPGGVRCSVLDAAVNVLGERLPDAWSANEKMIGHGYTGVPFDNIGLQYGLASLQDGTISVEQFLDLNARIGSFDYDFNPSATRQSADQPALTNIYRSGMVYVANNLGSVAIIDCRGPNFGLVHDSFRSFALRARLDAELGGHDNQVIWEGPHLFDAFHNDKVACLQTALVAMDQWMAAVESDNGAQALPAKLIGNKPAGLGDACWTLNGVKRSDGLCPDSIVPVYGTPRTVAGDSILTESNKCQLKPLNRSDDYGGKPLSDAQWQQLQQIFPQGVCDFSRPPDSKQGTIPWMTYQDERGNVVYGGKALPPAPAESDSGWSSPAFRMAAAAGAP